MTDEPVIVRGVVIIETHPATEAQLAEHGATGSEGVNVTLEFRDFTANASGLGYVLGTVIASYLMKFPDLSDADRLAALVRINSAMGRALDNVIPVWGKEVKH